MKRKITARWWIYLGLSLIALSGAIKINAQQPACSTNHTIQVISANPACTTKVAVTFSYNNPTGNIVSVEIRLGSGANAKDSVCLNLNPGTGTLTTPCLTGSLSDTIFTEKYPLPNCICSPVLPVTFISFTAEENNSGGIKLTWEAEVVNEPSSHFKVEKSTDGREFSVIALVFADQSIRKYSFTDPNPGGNGKVFYRIVFTNNTGTKKYSTVQLVSFEKNNDVKHFLDGTGTLRIQGLPSGEIANAVILDMSGKIIHRNQSRTDQLFSSGIPVYSLPTGIYVVNVTTQTKTYSGKFFKN